MDFGRVGSLNLPYSAVGLSELARILKFPKLVIYLTATKHLTTSKHISCKTLSTVTFFFPLGGVG